MLDVLGERMVRRDFAAGIEARLHQDFGLVLEAARKSGGSRTVDRNRRPAAQRADGAGAGAGAARPRCCGHPRTDLSRRRLKAYEQVRFLVALLLFAGTPPLALADIRSEPLRFEKGRNGASLKGTLKGDEIIDYRLRATAGQILDVNLQTDHRAAHFDVLPPDDQPALFVGSLSGNSFIGALPRDRREYTVRIYLMRPAAQRNESARYTVNLTMAGGKAVSGTTAADPPPIYDASGKLQCAAGEPAARPVVRFPPSVTPNAAAPSIWIAHRGAPRQRVLHYAGKRFSTTDDGAGVAARQQDDNWLVSVGGREFYLIPRALIHGGLSAKARPQPPGQPAISSLLGTRPEHLTTSSITSAGVVMIE